MAAHTSLWAYTKVCRLEYLRGEAPAVLIPALITTTSVQALFAPAVLEAVAVFAILYLAGFIVNALVDRDLDVKYDTFKREIGEATNKLGVRRMRAILAAHLIVALGLSVHLSMVLRAPELFALAAVGTFLAMAYSLPPLHFKVRGVAAHAVSLSLSAFAIPFLFLYRVAAGEIDAMGWAICGAFTLTHYGLTYTNQAYDFDLDKREGVQTPPVRVGLRRSLVASAIMTTVGLTALTVAVVMLALSRSTVASAWGAAGGIAIVVGTPMLLWLGYGVPLRGVLRMLRTVRDSPSEEEAVPKMREAVNYANFHAAGIAALAAFALVFFAATVQASSVLDQAAVDSLEFVHGPSIEAGQGPGSTTISYSIHNGGTLTMPASSVQMRATVHGPGGALVATVVLTAPRALAPGATHDQSFVLFQSFPSGTVITLTLVMDANRDNLDVRTVDRATLTVP